MHRRRTGKTTGAVLVFRDISEKYRSEKESQYLAARLDALFQNAPIELALFDADLRFIDLNDRAVIANGITKQEHFGKTVSELLPNIGETVEPILRDVRDSVRV